VVRGIDRAFMAESSLVGDWGGDPGVMQQEPCQ